MIQGRLPGRKDRWRACRKSGLHGQCFTAGRTRSEVKTMSGRLRLQYIKLLLLLFTHINYYYYYHHHYYYLNRFKVRNAGPVGFKRCRFTREARSDLATDPLQGRRTIS